MLVLTRKRQEGIEFTCGGKTVVVKALDFGGGRMRLGLVAPPEVGIKRVGGKKEPPLPQIELSKAA